MFLLELWKNHGFEILLGVCLLFLMIYSLFRRGKKGTWGRYKFVKEDNGEKEKTPQKESKGETECRRVLENLFGKKFPKERPDFLRNEVTGNFNLELDCYNQELGIACEYNGIQHYKFVPYFHKNNDAFQNQKYRDYMKKELCKKKGVTLIEVPYTVKIQDIESYIKKKLI